MKKTGPIAVLLLVVLLLMAVSCAASLPPPSYIPFTLPDTFALPGSRLVALGTATHGNAEPIMAALETLQYLQKERGQVVLILEEMVGDGMRVDQIHSFYDEKAGAFIGFTNVYNNAEMDALLSWVAQEDVRIYGVDIQSILVLLDILGDAMHVLGFPRADEIELLWINSRNGTYASQIERHMPLVEEIKRYLAQQWHDGLLTEQDYDRLSHLVHCIEQHYEYHAGGQQFDTRDRMMAENTMWVLAHESKYHGDVAALLFASNGHMVASPYDLAGITYTPMGYHLSEWLGSDYYAIVTEARHNYFLASSNLRNSLKKRTFYVERTGPLSDTVADEEVRLLFLPSEFLQQQGISQWDLTTIGWYFKNSRAKTPKQFTINTSVSIAYDAMLYFNQLTPNNEKR